ncbi:hypothetical protein G9A89_019020 [Geosiphon pyriformis]|nr:hypothetical protein G9A89_019020 [Geosiphon pyriformis]
MRTYLTKRLIHGLNVKLIPPLAAYILPQLNRTLSRSPIDGFLDRLIIHPSVENQSKLIGATSVFVALMTVPTDIVKKVSFLHKATLSQAYKHEVGNEEQKKEYQPVFLEESDCEEIESVVKEKELRQITRRLIWNTPKWTRRKCESCALSAIHYFILDLNDNFILKHFDESNFNEIAGISGSGMLEVSDEVVEYLNQFMVKVPTSQWHTVKTPRGCRQTDASFDDGRIMDSPKGYICRIRRSDLMEVPETFIDLDNIGCNPQC